MNATTSDPLSVAVYPCRWRRTTDESLHEGLVELKLRVDAALAAADPNGSSTPSAELLEAYARMRMEVAAFVYSSLGVFTEPCYHGGVTETIDGFPYVEPGRKYFEKVDRQIGGLVCWLRELSTWLGWLVDLSSRAQALGGSTRAYLFVWWEETRWQWSAPSVEIFKLRERAQAGGALTDAERALLDGYGGIWPTPF